MPAPIAIFYHCLFFGGDDSRLLPSACSIVQEQMAALSTMGLLDAAQSFFVGVNGGEESQSHAARLIPKKAEVVFHGLQCRNECRTIRMIEKWLPGHENWYVLYHHSKGATHTKQDARTVNWRKCMQKHCVSHWRRCCKDLDTGYDAVGCHWLTPPFTPPGQYIFAGTFFWAKASYLLTIPPLMERDRIQVSGIDALQSRYEAEVWIGNGRRRPRIYDYHKGWNVDSKPHP